MKDCYRGKNENNKYSDHTQPENKGWWIKKIFAYVEVHADAGELCAFLLPIFFRDGENSLDDQED